MPEPTLKQIFLASVMLFGAPFAALAAADAGESYKGLEYFGSSQLTTMELEKILALKPGASLIQVQKALDRLDKSLEARHIPNNLEVVAGEPGSVFISVDILDSSNETVPTRKLKNPRHVLVRSEKPFIVLDELTKRLEKLTQEGRTWSESYRDGCKYYSDEPSNQCVAEIERFAPDMREELLAVVESDPDATRRRKAIELLGWSGEVPYTANRLTDAFDDSDPKVRVAAIKYVFPRLSMLPEDYPYIRLVQAASRELNRPSHQDRSKALYVLLWLAKKNVLFVRDIKQLDEARLKQLASDSVLPTVKVPAQQLLDIIAQWDKGPLSQ
ncbi:MAG: HEAT repeat domain-containing protein [Candidatus Melainabacteria bacterium]|nr:MAG: HEAT repeat domain-containing protein [Candidatus Melainabacteria bacterium]